MATVLWIDGGVKFDEDGEPTVVVGENRIATYTWKAEDVCFADWKDTEEIIRAVASCATEGGDVVSIQDQSDTYIFASTAKAAIVAKKTKK